MNDNTRLNRLLARLAHAAAVTAEDLGEMVHYAGHILSEKIDSAKLNCVLSRHMLEQEEIFTEIGRTLYLLQGDAFSPDDTTGRINAQQDLDKFLLLASDKQKVIDRIADNLSLLAGCQVCPACSCVCEESDCFCSDCGAALPLATL